MALMMPPRIRLFLPALVLAVGLAAAGHFVGKGIGDRNGGRRVISVKGLAEKEVAASLAIWNVVFVATANDLAELNSKLAASREAVVGFLKEAGFEDEEMAVQPPAVRDLRMEFTGNNAPPPAERYLARQSVLLRTPRVELVKPAVASVANLMIAGVLVAGGHDPNYIFNELNEIKPGMIQEATQNARLAAEQFARDSQAALGKLHSASQGLFQIEDRDPATPERKTVRVVVHVEYEVD